MAHAAASQKAFDVMPIVSDLDAFREAYEAFGRVGRLVAQPMNHTPLVRWNDLNVIGVSPKFDGIGVSLVVTPRGAWFFHRSSGDAKSASHAAMRCRAVPLRWEGPLPLVLTGELVLTKATSRLCFFAFDVMCLGEDRLAPREGCPVSHGVDPADAWNQRGELVARCCAKLASPNVDILHKPWLPAKDAMECANDPALHTQAMPWRDVPRDGTLAAVNLVKGGVAVLKIKEPRDHTIDVELMEESGRQFAAPIDMNGVRVVRFSVTPNPTLRGPGVYECRVNHVIGAAVVAADKTTGPLPDCTLAADKATVVIEPILRRNKKANHPNVVLSTCGSSMNPESHDQTLASLVKECAM